MAEEISLIKEAREVVRVQPLSLRTLDLRNNADALDRAYRLLCESCTRENITNFNAQVTRTIRAIERVHKFDPPPPVGGRARAPETGLLPHSGAL